MSKEDDNKAIVVRWFTDFWGENERGPFLQTKLADQESRDRARDFEISTGEDAEEPGRSQHERKAQAIVVSTQPIGDLAVASVQVEILRQLIRRRSGGKIG
jgi:hypothetical protein